MPQKIDDIINDVWNNSVGGLGANLAPMKDDVLYFARFGYGKGAEAAQTAMRKGDDEKVRETFGAASLDYLDNAVRGVRAGFEKPLQTAQTIGKGQQFANLQPMIIAITVQCYCLGAAESFEAGKMPDMAKLAYEAASAAGQKVIAVSRSSTNYNAKPNWR